MNSPPRTRVLLVDDHVLFRKAIASLLNTSPDFAVIGEAANGQEACELARSLRPDLILMDLGMPVMNGLEATRRITAAMPNVRIVILTVSDDDENLSQAKNSGACGYLLKEMTADAFFRALRTVMQGKIGFWRAMTARVLDAPRHIATRETESRLTDRQSEILQWVALGKSNKEIAIALHIAEATVKNHVQSIVDKLHLENRLQAALYALRSQTIPGRQAS